MPPCDRLRTFEAIGKVDLMRDSGLVGEALQVEEEGEHHVEVGGFGEPGVGRKMRADEFLDQTSCGQLHGCESDARLRSRLKA